MRILGVLLIVLGIAALSYRGFTYTEHEKVFQVGKIEAVQKKDKTVPIPPIVGGTAVAGGVALLLLGRRS